MAPTQDEMLKRITAWNKLCEQEDLSMKTRYKRWQVIVGFVGFVLVMAVVGHLEQTPDTTSPQAAIDEKVGVRDALRAQTEADERAAVAFYNERARR
ncbi:MAG: hypothetical protein C5B59_01435 [Bacteroidetes bacterium]|nr:MAG: hypothetical protein C5B59_01435 [Bacteroidota bacterium]